MDAKYTVNQLARLAGVSRRTLHYYDQIGLLKPDATGDNRYRYYGEPALLRLQQIRFYRELGLSLEQIIAVLEQPDFDLLSALEGHKQALLQRVEQTKCLIETVEKTMQHLRGEIKMSDKDFYQGFDEEQQKRYAEEAAQRWGEESVAESSRRWNAYTPAQKNAILAENNQITLGIANSMEKGFDSPEVQYWVGRWHQAISTHFYPCSLVTFEALGHGYVSDPRFAATYEKVRTGLSAFMGQAMVFYCQKRSE
jgi:DNA-binding transcriptional MerR regulator